MKHMLIAILAGALAAGLGIGSVARSQSVLTYHAANDRSGRYLIPGLTWERARGLHLDERFHATVSGHVYAQPLYWHPPGAEKGTLLVATEDNVVYAIDAVTGGEIWKRSVGRPVPRSSLPCGDINPLGITGTPAIDEDGQAIYLDAAVEGTSGPRHLVFGLSLRDGSPLPGWPIDVADALGRQHQAFESRNQNQRGAVAIVEGTLYVPFGGHFGDCG